jgi:Protein of unknown function (DUF4012)
MQTVESVRITTRESGQRVKRRRGRLRRMTRKFYLLALAFLLIALVGSGLGALFGYLAYSGEYQRDLSLAHTGEQHLQKAAILFQSLAQNPFDATTIDHVRQELVAAHTAFVQLDGGLESLPGVSTLIPVYGGRLSASMHLATAAVGLTEAGIVGCSMLSMLVAVYHDPLGANAQGLTSADFNSIEQDSQQAKALLEQAITEVRQVQPGDIQFIPQVSKMLGTFQSVLPTAQAWLSAISGLFPVLPSILGIGGTPSHYLIEVLDSTELRPGGGFIGNYGIATLMGGRLASARISDTQLLDHPFENAGHTIPYPLSESWFSNYLAGRSWSLRDSNLVADFPTSAQYGELNYRREGGIVPLQGVIAITPALIQHALAITGPIDVPEYHETVTPQNLIALIHFHQLGGPAAGQGSSFIPSPDGHSSERKRFTELLAEHFLARVQQLPSAALPKFLNVLADSLRTKDLQVYFNNSAAERVLQLIHVDDAIQAPSGDHLFIVDANVSPSKANSFIVNTVRDQVTVDEQGNATHHTSIAYNWTLAGNNYGGSPIYRDYIRVYLPLGSTISEQSGWQYFGKSTAYGNQVLTGFFTLVFGQTRIISLVWTSHGTAQRGVDGWQYHYLLQKQAGIQRKLSIQVTLPSCAATTSSSGGLVLSHNRIATLSESWIENLDVGLAYQQC